MKPRKVVLTLECRTDAPLSVLQRAKYYPPLDVVKGAGHQWLVEVCQAQANVVASKKPGGLGKR